MNLNKIKFKKTGIMLLTLIVLAIPLLINFLKNKPLLMGSESYYHLSQQASLTKFYYYPLQFLKTYIPENILIVIPIIITILSLILLFQLAKRMKIKENLFLLFLVILIFTPTFIISNITLSSYPLFILLISIGALLLTTKKIKYLSILPFILATFIDSFSTILLLIGLIIYTIKYNKNKLGYILSIFTFILLLFNYFLLKLPFILGPFHSQLHSADLISDFGGFSGISFFVIILAFIGLIITTSKHKFNWTYVFLLLTLTAFIINTQVIYYLAILIIFFATLGLDFILEKSWNLDIVKKITIWIILLSILFSFLSFMQRIENIPPTANDLDSLQWIKENTPKNAIIFSTPENSYLIKHFAKREPFYFINKETKQQKNITKNIFLSTYPKLTFPLLQQNNISVIYVTPKIKSEFPAEQGLLFLFNNENFKLTHFSDNYEVWLYLADQ